MEFYVHVISKCSKPFFMPNFSGPQAIGVNISSVYHTTEMCRTTAVYALSTSTSRRIWAGGGSTNRKVITPTSVQEPVRICGARTLNTAM